MGIMQLVKGAFSTVFTNEAGLTANRSIAVPDSSGTMLLDTTLGGKTLTLATAQASTSGTSIDFTGIPSWAKRVTVMFNGVSTNGLSQPLIQIGAGSVDATGYLGTGQRSLAASSNEVSFTTGFGINGAAATYVYRGTLTLISMGSNLWAASGALTDTSINVMFAIAGNKTLAGTLDRIRITTVNGTDTFDAGSINIMYEG